MKQGTMSEAIKQVIDNQLKQETLEEIKQSYFKNGFKEGAKWQQERSYSEEEVYDLMDKREHYWVRYKNYYAQSYIPFDEWFEQFKKK